MMHCCVSYLHSLKRRLNWKPSRFYGLGIRTVHKNLPPVSQSLFEGIFSSKALSPFDVGKPSSWKGLNLGHWGRRRDRCAIARCANLMRSRESFWWKPSKQLKIRARSASGWAQNLSFSINMVIKGLPAIKYFGLIKRACFRYADDAGLWILESEEYSMIKQIQATKSQKIIFPWRGTSGDLLAAPVLRKLHAAGYHSRLWWPLDGTSRELQITDWYQTISRGWGSNFVAPTKIIETFTG